MDCCHRDRSPKQLALQWGHGREAMDGRMRSMTPLGVIHFNGAMAVRSWMVVQVNEATAEQQTSMGPWP